MNCTENHVIARRLRATPAKAEQLTTLLSAFFLAVIFGIAQFSDAFGQIVHQESRTGSAAGSITVATSASLTGANGQLYLAAISTRPKVSVASISGLGLTWTFVKSKCGGRNTTSIEVWMAQGTPSGSGLVTATFASAPTTAVIAVSRYSGVAASSPVGNSISGNVNGLNAAGACSGGTDGNSYSFNLATSINDAFVYSAAAIKDRLHTAGAAYTERAEIQMPNGVTTSGVAVEDRTVAAASAVAVNGSLDGVADWAMVALEIKPGPPQVQVTVNTVGSGTVTLNPPGGFYTSGTAVTLTATPASGFQFSGWSGSLGGSTNPATIAVNSNMNITATFTTLPPPQHTLTINTVGSGSVTLNPAAGTYDAGTVVSLTATPASGFQFSGWSDDLSGATNPASITMNANKTVTATFTALPVQHTLTVNTAGSGSVTLNPPGGTYNAGTVVTLTATPASGFAFSGWSEDLSGATNPANITMNANKNVTATFTLIPVLGPVVHEERVSGSASGSATVSTAASLSGISGQLYLAAISTRPKVSVSSISGLGLVWTQVKSKCGGRNTTSIEVWMAQGTPSGSGLVTATFANAPTTAVITVSRYSGVATSNPIGEVIAGNANGLNAAGACTGGIDGNSYSFNLITTVNEALVYGAVAIKDRAHTPGGAYTERAEIQQPNGITTSGVAVEDRTVSSASTVTVNGSFDGAADWALVALEIKPGPAAAQHTLTVNTVGSGTVLRNPSGGTYSVGTVVTLTATPASGFQFSGWSGDLSGATNPATITMNANKTVTATFTELPVQHTLTVNTVGSGSVTLNPPGGTYNPGTVVTLTATPASGFQFSGWSGDLSGSTNPVNITMNANKNVTATFGSVAFAGPVVHEERVSGSASGSVTVTTAASLSGISGQLYLAAISTRPKVSVSSISGLGLTWTQVKSKCGGRNTTSIEVWMAQGTPSGSGLVTATFANAPTTAVITVSRYSGVATSNPIGEVIAGNSNGLNSAGACSGGADGNSYSFNLTTTVNEALVYGAVAIKDRAHTPGANYTERAEIQQPNGITTSGVAVADRTVSSASTVAVNGSFDGAADWALVALEIKPGPAAAQHTLTVNTVGSGTVLRNPSGGTYSVGTVVTLTATPASGFQFSGWSGDLSGATNPATITMNSDKNVTATFTELPAQHTLTVNTVGSGSVTLNPPGGTYNPGTVVTLTATPASGFQFSGWSGDLSGSTNPVNITMNANRNVTATFGSVAFSGPVIHEERVSGSAAGSITVTTAASLSGISGQLYLAAISSRPKVSVSSISGLGLTWTLVKSKCGGRNTTSIEVWMAQGTPSGSGLVTATFANAPATAVITVSRYSGVATSNPIGNSIAGNANGLNAAGACTGGADGNSYSFNLITTVSEALVYGAVAIKDRAHTPGANYTERAEIQQPNGVTTSGVAVEDRTVSSASTVTVNGSFDGAADWAVVALEIKPGPAAAQHTLAVNTVGSGTVLRNPSGGTYSVGTVVTLTATPASGFLFSGWSGDLSGATNPATITMNGNKTVTATFTEIPQQFTLTVNSDDSGSVMLDPAGGIYNSGTVVTLTAVPDSGYKFSGWSGDLSGATNPATITMNGNKTVAAAFAPLPKHPLAINLLGAGTVAANPSDSLLVYYEGTVVTLTATPAAGFQFTGWSGDLSGAANPAAITLDTSKTVMATFTPISVTNNIAHEETQTGGSSNSTSVTTAASLAGVSGQFYLAAVSTRPHLPVTGISGLGLTWTLVKTQCSGRNNTGVEVWMAQGAPTSNSAVTATFANPPLSAAIAVSRYSGMAQTNPVGNVISGNTVGLDGLCALGVDTSLYSFNLATTRDGAVVYGAVAVRTRTHTPGSGYTERAEFIQGLLGSAAGVAVQDRSVGSPATVAVNGTLSGKTDWAVVAIEIRPRAKLVVSTVGSGSVTLDPPGNSYPNGTVVTLTAIADAGFEFSGWSGDLSGSDNPTTITMNGQKNVTATFTPISAGGQITHHETQTGSSVSSLTVATSANLTAVSGHLYLAAISTRAKVQVTGVSGLGLTWTLVKSQCAGRGNTMVEVWMAQGSPTHNSPVTANFGSKPSNAVIAVSRYSGAHASSPIGSLTSGNTVGADGPCAGGSDSNAYSFNLTTTVNDAMVYGAAALRSRTHTPGSGYTERGEIMQGTTGAAAAVAVQEQAVASPATIAVDGSLSGNTDWAMIAFEIKPQSSSSLAKRAGQSGASAIPAAFQLEQNYPNPFNPSTMISFALPAAGQVTVNVYNQAGQLVRTLVEQAMAAGRHQIRWNGRNQSGKTVAAGFYLYQIVVRDNAGRAAFTETRRMLFVK